MYALLFSDYSVFWYCGVHEGVRAICGAGPGRGAQQYIPTHQAAAAVLRLHKVRLCLQAQ